MALCWTAGKEELETGVAVDMTVVVVVGTNKVFPKESGARCTSVGCTAQFPFLSWPEEEFEYVNPIATMYPKVELTSEERLNYINNLLVEGAKRTSKPEAPAPKSKEVLTPKEKDLQNKIDMLQRHNDLLMDTLDKAM